MDTMDLDALSKEERTDILATMADLYYNQQLTQIEIAKRFDTTRFKVAKLIQDARDEHVVEIKVNFSNERNRALEDKLRAAFGLTTARVVNTRYASFIEGLKELGQIGAMRLSELLNECDAATLGITWGKSIQAVIEQLPQETHPEMSAVQLAGNFDSARPTSESYDLVRETAAKCLGTPYHLNAPLYIKSDALRHELMAEPDLMRTITRAGSLEIALTGIAANSSLPALNPRFSAYLTDEDRALAATSPGAIFGYTLDEHGEVADTPLNRKLVAVPYESLMAAPHRLGVAHGRNKARVASLVAKSGLITELVTDAETATLMLELA